MKKYLSVIAVIIMCSAFHLNAQENLDKWFKKCENTPDIDLSVITTKKKDNQLDSRVVKVSFRDNEPLLKDLLEAFSKDKENAYKMSEKRVKGIMRPDYCRFAKGKLETVFLFEFKSNGETYVTMKVVYDYNDADRYPFTGG